MNSFKLKILATDKKVYEGPVESLTVPGAAGYLGIWAHHCPVMTLLGKGQLTYRDTEGKTSSLPIDGNGFFEFSKNTAVILIDN
ncbi:MAG: F0F1 ATP synthase subunit epsilon [Candidatus Omnitrophica bacterium]|nr:F0F1 ATP synthase subunit epsilon [Candidatus Omnitrophota bacterium]